MVKVKSPLDAVYVASVGVYSESGVDPTLDNGCDSQWWEDDWTGFEDAVETCCEYCNGNNPTISLDYRSIYDTYPMHYAWGETYTLNAFAAFGDSPASSSGYDSDACPIVLYHWKIKDDNYLEIVDIIE